MKVADVVPAGTVTVAWTDAVAGSELNRLTTAPPGGATCVSVTLLAVVGIDPPMTETGDTVTDERTAVLGLTVTTALPDEVPVHAEESDTDVTV
jgi:hypothetical protein